MKDVTVEGILHALADPVRLTLYAELAASTCSRSCSSLLGVSDQAVPKSTLSQHFRVLREAGLIRSERRGVEMQSSSRCAEIEQRFPGLIPAILAARGAQQRVESAPARGRRKQPVPKAS
jgi:DNA-binding transcriptional ArsR family regulator